MYYHLILGQVSYDVTLGGGSGTVSVEVLDPSGATVASGSKANDVLAVPNAKLWWPFSMSGQNFTDMYILKVRFLRLWDWLIRVCELRMYIFYKK